MWSGTAVVPVTIAGELKAVSGGVAELSEGFALSGSLKKASFSGNVEDDTMSFQFNENDGFTQAQFNSAGGYFGKYVNGTWTPIFNFATKNDFSWKELTAVDVSDTEATISYNGINAHEIMISYGIKNNTQSLDGGTLVIGVNESKSCHLPLYTGEAIIGFAYIYNNMATKKISLARQSGTQTLRFIIWYR